MNGTHRSPVSVLLVVLLAIVAVFGGGLAYLQTEHGFAQVVRPVVADLLPGELRVKRGTLSLLGGIELEDAHYLDEQDRFEVSLARATARVLPIDSLRQRRWMIRDLEVDSARVRIGPSILSTDRKEEVRDLNRPRWLAKPRLPVSIDGADIRDLRIRIVDEEGTRGDFGPMLIRESTSGVARIASFEVETSMALAPDEAGAAYSGTGAGTIVVRESVEGSLTGFEIDIDSRVNSGSTPSGPTLDFHSHAAARLEPRGGWRLVAHTEAVREGGHLGRTELRFVQSAAARGDRFGALEGRVDLERLDAEFLNPLLTLLGRSRLAGGVVDGELDLSDAELDTPGLRVRLSIDAEDLALVRGHDPTPPMTVHGDFDATWLSDDEEVRVDQADLRAVRSGSEVLRIDLSNAAAIDLNPEDRVGGKERVSRVELRVRASSLSIPLARLWLASSGVDSLAFLGEGILNGDLHFGIGGGGQDVSVDGQLEVRDARPIFGRGRSVPAPLLLTAEIDGALKGLQRFEISQLALDILAPNGSSARIQGSGSWDLSSKAVDLETRLDSGDLPRVVRALGFEPMVWRWRPERAVASGSLDVQRREGEETWRFGADLELDDLQVTGTTGRSLERDLRVEADINWATARNALAITRAKLSTRSEIGVGEIDANGFWPLDRVAPARTLEISVRDLPSRPWLGLVADTRTLRIPMLFRAAQLRLDWSPQEGRLELRGTQELALLPRDRRFSLSSSLQTIPGGVSFEVATVSDDASRDVFRLRGSYERASAPRVGPRLLIRGEVERLDTEPFLKWWASEDPDVSTPHSSVMWVLHEEDHLTDFRDDVTRDILDTNLPVEADVELEVAQAQYRELRATRAHTRFFRLDDVTRFQVEGGTLAGGDFSIDLYQEEGDETRRIDLESKGRGLDLGPLTRSIGRLQGERWEGRLDGSISVRGQAPADSLLRDTVRGKVELEVHAIRAVESDVLSFLASENGMPALHILAFDRGGGRLNVAGGWAEIEEMRLTGNAAQIDVSGRYGLDGALDMRAAALLGPDLAPTTRAFGGSGLLVRALGEFFALPVAVAVRGTTTDPRLIAVPNTPGVIGAPAKIIGGTMRRMRDVFSPSVEPVIPEVGATPTGPVNADDRP